MRRSENDAAPEARMTPRAVSSFTTRATACSSSRRKARSITFTVPPLSNVSVTMFCSSVEEWMDMDESRKFKAQSSKFKVQN
ncbi:MAG: hypothetical protein DCC52_13930 [Chloroflexi bacterium]|nr:MAG: hypothetical protein DCC52_13930 [Chloroflexota bacterium]